MLKQCMHCSGAWGMHCSGAWGCVESSQAGSDILHLLVAPSVPQSLTCMMHVKPCILYMPKGICCTASLLCCDCCTPVTADWLAGWLAVRVHAPMFALPTGFPGLKTMTLQTSSSGTATQPSAAGAGHASECCRGRCLVHMCCPLCVFGWYTSATATGSRSVGMQACFFVQHSPQSCSLHEL